MDFTSLIIKTHSGESVLDDDPLFPVIHRINGSRNSQNKCLCCHIPQISPVLAVQGVSGLKATNIWIKLLHLIIGHTVKVHFKAMYSLEIAYGR